jgi:Ran GTPase-activating protein (RanGAP) involved in mRNA processing and transport
MGKSVNGVIYNLAFSPKIKHIDLEGMQTDHEAAEALFKLINISGSIEILNLRYSSVVPQLAEDFWKAVGQSKTLKYLNVDMDTLCPS